MLKGAREKVTSSCTVSKFNLGRGDALLSRGLGFEDGQQDVDSVDERAILVLG